MTLDALKQSLEGLPDPSIVEGTAHLDEPLAIALPDGDLAALADKTFVAWLVEHSEDAPFGHHGETKIDKKVRQAKRLVARGNAIVAGFDPMSVLPAIEKALSPRFHLDAKLEDVIVYEKGGKFTRHKDTPRTANLVGTLVVGLPIAHEGGAFTIVDGGKKHVVDWSGKPTRDEVKRVALFSDLDHAIEPVKSGARVTLVYSLSRSDRPRSDAARDKKLAKLHGVVAALKFEDPLMIACTRQIVSDGQQPQALDTLRGTDREIAELFVEAGYNVAVRACLTGDDTEGRTSAFPDTSNMWAITRLSKAIPDHVIAEMDEVVSFTDTIDLEEYAEEDGGEVEGTTLGSYVLDMVQMERWVIRKRAAATAVYEGMYSETGSFGNEASIGHVYTLAAIEVSLKKAKPKPKAKAKAKKKSR